MTSLIQFRSAYQQYDQTLATTLQARCSDQPVAFYDSLTQARAQRSAIQKTVEEMSALIQSLPRRRGAGEQNTTKQKRCVRYR